MNNIAEFFSNIAERWDSMETTPSQTIDALLARCDIKEGDHVLDLACGTGIITEKLINLSHRKVIALDIAPKMIEIAMSKYSRNPLAEFLVGDFLEIRLSETFDKIIVYNAYPHFLDREAFREALLRNLKPGGEFSILHSLSRAALDDHHRGIESISRFLLPVDEEASFYKNDFIILDSEEDEAHYFIRGRKK